MIKVLFVCLGNICRSPLAEGIFKEEIKKRGWQHLVEVDSAGTSTYHLGEDPDPRSIEIAAANKITLNHKGRQITLNDLHEFDYVLAMDQENFRDIQRLKAKNQRASLFLMREFENDVTEKDVPDPYFGGDNGFQRVYEMLDRTIQNLLAHMAQEHEELKK